MNKKDLTKRIKDTVCKITGKSQTDYLLEKLSKKPGAYYLEMTGYTDKITDQSGNVTIVAPSDMRNIVFAANKLIISDYLKSGIEIENVPRKGINYFQFNRKEFNEPGSILIDLKAAYPSMLLKYEIITPETYDFLMQLKKGERLKAIGMLASKKIKVKMCQGEENEFIEVPEGKYSDLFFFAAYETGDLLNRLKQIAKDKFLFFWFDGIYIKKDYFLLGEICEEITKFGLSFSVSNLETFKAEKTKNNNFKISWKEVTNSEKGIIKNPKTKTLILPNKPRNQFRK